MVPLRIIRRLRHPRDGACRHCAAGTAARDTMMSHYFCRDLSLQPPALTLAVSALSRCVSPCAAAAPLVPGRCLAQLLPAAHVLAAPQAVRLSPVARATDPDGAPTAPALIPPIGSLHPRPRSTGQRRGKQAYKTCGEAPTGAPQRRGPGVDWYRARALALSADNHNETGHPVRHQDDLQRYPSGEISPPASLHSAAARPRETAVYGRRSRPSRRMLRI